jgi:peptidoglycan/xylan/chitin deacetylase (PgdA/CDA1 family)
MHVALDRFAATMRAVAAAATFVSLREMAERHRAGKSTRGLVALTFDDAYASVVNDAWDTIREQSLPVTLLVVSGAASSGVPYWWDRVEECFAAAAEDRWRRFEDECGVPNAFRRGQPPSMGRLRPLRQWILAEHQGRWPDRLGPALEKFESELGTRSAQRPSTFSELDRILKNPLVDVGAHSVSHPALPLLPVDEIRYEIRSSYRELCARYARTLPVLAPPYALYDDRTITIGKEEGLTWCLTLDATLLDDGAPSDMLARVGMMAQHRPWQAVLFALGWWRSVRPRRLSTNRYPELPSAST